MHYVLASLMAVCGPWFTRPYSNNAAHLTSQVSPVMCKIIRVIEVQNIMEKFIVSEIMKTNIEK
jgi:hypothetical protein